MTTQLEWEDMYLHKKKELEDLQLWFERARNYEGTEGWPCPLCEYRNGEFIKSCAMHRRITFLEKELSDANLEIDVITRINKQLDKGIRKAGG